MNTNEKSPPFNIGPSLDELNIRDFQDIFKTQDQFPIEKVGGGLSGAKIYKVTIKNKEYLVRYTSGIFGKKEIVQEFSIQQEMGFRGVSPNVFYSNPERGIVAMEYISNKLAQGRNPDILNNIPHATSKLVALIKSVHETKILNTQLSYRKALDYIRYSINQLPNDFLDKEDVQLLKRITTIEYPTDNCVITHNDFRSDNLLYDGDRFYLIDWELGGLGHPFYDLAYFANYQDLTVEEGVEVLSIYLDKKPAREQLTLFGELRRLAFGFSACLALPSLSSFGEEIKKSVSGEVSFSNIKELWQMLDNRILSFDSPRDEYRISLCLLHASASY